MRYATEKAAEGGHGSGAAEAAAEAAVVRGEELRDLEVLSIWFDHIDKTSESANKKQIADAAGGARQCSLVAAMLAVSWQWGQQRTKSEKKKAATVATEEAAAAAAATEAEGQRWQKPGPTD